MATIGTFLFWCGRLERTTPGPLVPAGVVTIVRGHLGAVSGALLVGTARYYRGSGFLGVFVALGLTLTLLLAHQALYAAFLLDVPALHRLAFLPLLMAAFLAFQRNGLSTTGGFQFL